MRRMLGLAAHLRQRSYMKMASDFDMEEYLRQVAAPADVIQTKEEPDLRLLKTLVTHHVTHVVFQNYDAQIDQEEVDMSPSALLERLLVQRRGGMCFESSELLLHVLQQFKFDARRVEGTTVFTDGEVRDKRVDDHQFIIVHLEGEKHLVDTAVGFNSIREPIPFKFDKNEQKTVTPEENYCLEVLEDHYVLNLKQRGAYRPMYRFVRPLTYLDKEQFLTTYRQCLEAVRSGDRSTNILKVGVVTDTGRIGLKLNLSSESEKRYSILFSHNHEPVKIERVSREKFTESIKAVVNLKDEHLKL